MKNDKYREEVYSLLDRITDDNFPVAKEYVDNKLAPTVDKIISIFENECLSYYECYKILEFTYQALRYKSEKVHL